MPRSFDRVPHIIARNKSAAAPQKWVVVDTETMPVRLDTHRWQHVYRLSVAAFWSRERASKNETLSLQRFNDRADQITAIAKYPRSKERVGVAAHNLDYDSQVLDTHSALRSAGYKLTKAVLEKGKWSQHWQRGGKAEGTSAQTLWMIDLANFFPMPLRDLAIWLGMRKGTLPDFDAPDEVWYQYCENDVRIELAALQHWLAFCEEHDLGYFAPTIAGQAFNAFRHRFMKHNIYVHVHDDVIALERAANYGGRCEPWWRGRAPMIPYVQLDASSMYGGVMAENVFPTKQVAHYGQTGITRLEKHLKTHSAIARVKIKTDVPAFPVRVNDKLRFPIGEFETTLATPELKLAIDYGYLVSCEEVVLYETAPLFVDYAHYFWNVRQEARKRHDEFTSKVAKRFLAALHGKFGQRIFTSILIASGVDREDEIWSEYDIEDARWYEYRSFAGRIEQRVREIPARDTLIAISAEVTSHARVKLWNWIVQAGFANVMYVDTDSLIIKRKALTNLDFGIDAQTLGGLRLLKESRTLYVRGQKWYRFGSENKRAGISGNARDIGRDQFEYDAFRSLRWALRHDNPHSAIVEEVKISAPYRNLLQKHGLGHAVTWRTVSEYANENSH